MVVKLMGSESDNCIFIQMQQHFTNYTKPINICWHVREASNTEFFFSYHKDNGHCFVVIQPSTLITMHLFYTEQYCGIRSAK